MAATLAALDEAALIERIQQAFGASTRAPHLALGIGDDAALLRLPAGAALVSTCDLAVEGQDFDRARFPAAAVGHRALAQNLSDLAAMGARPRGFLLALSASPGLPLAWLDGMLAGMAALARRCDCPLVGGDLSATAGPLTLAITALGAVPARRALRRDGARVGQRIWLSGSVGAAARGLTAVLASRRRPGRDTAGYLQRSPASQRPWLQACLAPEPRLALGQRLVGLASACIDVSDGLLRDLGRLADASGVAAAIDSAAVPRLEGVARAQALTGGEDFELLFTAAPRHDARLARLARRLGVALSAIGRVEPGRGLRVDGAPWRGASGFDHFAGTRRR